MRSVSLTAFLAVLVLAAPAMAGTLNATDNRGGWQSTKCQAPQPPAAVPHDPEADADSVTAQWTAHNQYVEVAQAYMNCLSQEAQADSTAAGQIITRSAQMLIQQTQEQISANAGRLQNKAAQ
jgi:hypothetical protein